MYSYYKFWATECTRQIPIHCSLAIKNLRMESLLFLFSKKDKFIFSYTFYKYSVLFSIHVISVIHTLISNFYKNRRRLKQTLESAQIRKSSLLAHTRVFLVEHPLPARTHARTHALSHTHTHTHTHTMDVDEDSASSPGG